MVKLVEAIKSANENLRHYFGFEFFAPTSEAGMLTLYDKIERLSSLDPLFCAITWGDFGKTADTSIEVASTCQTLLSVNYQVNITGYTSTREDVIKCLTVLKAKGVRNLLATRGNVVAPRDAYTSLPHPRQAGEPPRHLSTPAAAPAAVSGGSTATRNGPAFPHAVDLVRFIRQEFGNYFGIAVVASPEAENLDEEIAHLREKIDAGADYVITQPLFDADVFATFLAKCATHGIRCPILPGVLPVTNARQLRTLDLMGRSGVAELSQRLSLAEDSGEGDVRLAVVAAMQELVRSLFAAGAGGAYFFTMNSDSTIPAIIKGLNLSTHRAFPWRPSENEERRRKETVRPIHWSSRVTSYMVRTAQWKDFQSSDKGHPDLWGSSGGYHAKLLLRSRAKRCAQFLALGGVSDIPQAMEELCRIFVNFLEGTGTLPWADELSGETAYVDEIILKPLNARGLFTINSQPQVNGVPSSNRVVGWGPQNGFIYQKGYVEFFCPATSAQTVFTTLDKYPTLQYMAVNSTGTLVRSNWPIEEPDVRAATATATASDGAPGHPPANSPGSASWSPVGPAAAEGDHLAALTSASAKLFGSGITAVTWGVFPGREVIQPTIVSVDSFRAWVGEAFDLWAAPFPSNDIPPVIQMIQSSWLLVNVVDNMYQETPSPLERAVLEICSKIPPLIPVEASPMVPPPIDAAGPRPSSGTVAPASSTPVPLAQDKS